MLTYLSLSGTAVLRFGGKLCGSRARAFGEELAELRQRGINTAIVDLRECRSLDSLGIRALVEAGAGLDLRIVVDAAACAAVTQGLEALAGPSLCVRKGIHPARPGRAGRRPGPAQGRLTGATNSRTAS